MAVIDRLQRKGSVHYFVGQDGEFLAIGHTASTLMSQLGISNDVINECENHIKQGMSGIYIQDRREAEQVKAFDALGQSLALLQGMADGNVINVVAIQRSLFPYPVNRWRFIIDFRETKIGFTP